ncbi:hypothetical protein [uncultured Algibacter sp.]|uniref:hypothetical protein n=1 Tax=uncultured Algibacter sp. TaxID=298659 RepID=UPI0032167E5D
MTTENKKDPAHIFTLYEELGISNVSNHVIVFDHSYQREKNAKMYYSLLIGLPFLMTILSYNTQDFIAFLGTILFTVGVFIYSKNKYNIWYKKISFNNVKGTITYKRHFPKKNLVFKYDTMHISSKTHCIKNSCSLYFYISKKGQRTKKEKKHALFTGYIYATDNDKELFVKFLNKFMEEGTLPKDLKLFNKAKII